MSASGEESAKAAAETGERSRQSARTALLIRPAAFGANPETASSNAFQQALGDATPEEVRAAALAELDELARALRAAGVHVVCVEDTRAPAKPDAVFPNNWISFHADGTLVLYPLLSPARRTEVRVDVVAAVEAATGSRWPRRVDLTALARERVFLEGTGSLVLDRVERIAYACRSSRTSAAGLAAWADALDYEVHAFDALDENGTPYYHTNVMMSIGTGWAVACLESLSDPSARARLEAKLSGSGRALYPLTRAQVRAMAGNVLELCGAGDAPLIALSRRAHDALGPTLRAQLGAHARLLPVPFDTIETHGGGSVRCALAAVHLPAP